MQQRQPANWFKTIDLSDSTKMYISSGGAVKFEQNGRLVCMFPASQLEAIHLIMTSLDPSLIEQVKEEGAKAKVQKSVDKEIAKVQSKAVQHLQALHDIAKAKGLNPETYLAQVFSGKVS